VQNAINTINALNPQNNNFAFDFTGIPNGFFDFESVFLHELGHSLGLAHCNLGGAASGATDFTNTTNGVDNIFNTDDATDGVDGTADDIRGDDVLLNFFRTSDNNPFGIAATVDQTTYSAQVANLPAGDNFCANASRQVSAALGFGDSEACMNQGTFNNEAQRELGFDDVAGLRYAMTGVDEIAGTADDYIINVVYAGMVAAGGADIVVDYDDAQTGFAVSQSGGFFTPGSSGTHITISTNNIYFNTGFNWFFNAILPVELLNFLVQAEEENALLEWTTATEINHSHFEIQRSYNLKDWANIGKVMEAESTVNDLKKYQFADRNIAQEEPNIYYRLKSVDNDGQFEYSDIKLIENTISRPTILGIAPNPISPQTELELRLPQEQEVTVRILNLNGAIMENFEFSGIKGINKFQIGKRLNLNTGIYFMEIQAGSFIEIRQIVQ